MTSNLPIVKLNPGSDRRIRRGHCWVYSNEVGSVTIDGVKSPLAALPLGQAATIINESGYPIATAYFNAHTLLCGRIYSRKGDESLEALLVERIRAALSWREACFSQPYYRLIYGDGDGLPGLVVDRFAGILVLQVTTAGMYKHLNSIVLALQQVVKPQGILLRNDAENESEQLPAQTEVLFGEVPEYCQLIENGVSFSIPLMVGQKTGWFFDHRDSREYLRRFVKGKRVLDVYSYLGGWGMQALDAGASELVCIDRSDLAIQLLGKNLLQQDFDQQSRLIKSEAIQALKMLAAEGEQFDVIILDPPAFIKRRKDQRNGEKSYHQVNQRAMKLFKPQGGVMVSASCSLHLSSEALRDIVKVAAHKAGHTASFIHQGGLGADHPVASTIPEMDYLKTVFARIS